VHGTERVGDFIGSTEWVDGPWHGRRLTIRVGTFGAQGRTTGYRWIVVRLTTTRRLDEWTDVAMRSHGEWEGIGLPVTPDAVGPRGTWADEPELSARLWAFAERVLPHHHPSEQPRFAVLQARNDAVLWQLRASRLDAQALTDAILLLEQVATYAEGNDAALTARLGRAAGVKTTRRLEVVFTVIMLGLLTIVIAGIFVLTAVL
jgi:hypothetical protein